MCEHVYMCVPVWVCTAIAWVCTGVGVYGCGCVRVWVLLVLVPVIICSVW